MTITETPQHETEAYLRRLDRAARWLPRDQAAELHEQIESHLAESLPPDVDQRGVREALAQLGEPHVLVREAAGPRRRLRTRLRRVRWWTWTVVGIVVAGLVSTATVLAVTLIPEYRAPDMICSCGFALTSHFDNVHEREIEPFNATEVALRSNHQGFEFDIYNTGHVTQTVLGLDSRPLNGYLHNYTLRIGSRDEDGAPLTNRRFVAAPVTIAPGQDRAVVVSWNHLECSAPRAEYTVTSVYLRVRIGPFTRSEKIDLGGPVVFKVPKPSTTTPATRCISAAAHEH
jgi:hypothetical protein